MSKKINSLSRTSSAALAAGTGAVMCLSATEAMGAFVFGNITSSTQNITQSPNETMYAFEKMARWKLKTYLERPYFLGSAGNAAHFKCLDSYAVALNAGVTVSGVTGFGSVAFIPEKVDGKYFAVMFAYGGGCGPARYGWLHVVSYNAEAKQLKIDKWGYEDTGASIKTLSDSVKTTRLALSDGLVSLRWANPAEDGVASYAIQAQKDGKWVTVDTFAPGAGNYSAKVKGDAVCRLVAERVDGGTDTFAF